jgi:rhodanese-related sulfurtransferase
MRRLSLPDLPADAVLVDVRDELETAARPLAAVAAGRQVVLVGFDQLEAGKRPDLPAGRLAVVVCTNGAKGDLAAAYLEALGAPTVAALEGGYRALASTGEAVKRD